MSITASTCSSYQIAEEGQGIEDQRVHGLAGDGGADRAHPQEAALGAHLHLGQDERVRELAAEVGDERGEHDARSAAEDGLEGGLVRPAGGGGKASTAALMKEAKMQRPEAGPHDLARARVAVDLGEDVAEHVADGEEQDAGPEGEADQTWPPCEAPMRFAQRSTVTNAAMTRS